MMRLLTWNLRFDSQPDDISVTETLESLPDPLSAPEFMRRRHEQPWSARRIRVAQEIRGSGVVVIGFQEALLRQVRDLKELLGDEWDWVGVGRDDGKEGGEFGPIFYNIKHLKLEESDTFWLSDTPFKPSRYPSAGSFRIATVARLSVIPGNSISATGERAFIFINTHLDERSEGQRELGASLILHRARYEASKVQDHASAVIVVGDFNSEQTGSDSGAYRILTGVTLPKAIPLPFKEKFPIPDDHLRDFTMSDFLGATPRLDVSGYFRTFTGFEEPLGMKRGGRIDYVLGGSNGGWAARRYRTGSTITDDGMLASDHRPVFVDLELVTSSPK
ncbi:hypothetical protein FRB94_012751 [Tulasnella sp. JGI-2019a]|nr:hypothetical protein FRB94_012751 [Tulasnella sp. JGI-2019a]KAG9018464.1 hypothetical protein FRB93_000167 [Tulasnella sp. JGI-2019a]